MYMIFRRVQDEKNVQELSSKLTKKGNFCVLPSSSSRIFHRCDSGSIKFVWCKIENQTHGWNCWKFKYELQDKEKNTLPIQAFNDFKNCAFKRSIWPKNSFAIFSQVTRCVSCTAPCGAEVSSEPVASGVNPNRKSAYKPMVPIWNLKIIEQSEPLSQP